jgi:glycyl-radical enzyme activating protein
MTSAMIFDIQRNSLHDGPGIRTTVFMKGCPLRCLWCHNPESFSEKQDLAFFGDRCTMCGACVDACPHHVHSISNNLHHLDRSACRFCGRCVEACLFDAVRITGKRMTVEEVLRATLRDIQYYRESGGGLTLSGGEPMQQFDFVLELLEKAKKEGIHTCLDTCGMAPVRQFEAVLPHVDLFLFDIKATDPTEHARLTGVSNDRIMANLRFIYRMGGQLELRFPLVPGVNDNPEHLDRIRQLKIEFPGTRGFTIMPYHHTGSLKYTRYGIENRLPRVDPATGEQVHSWQALLNFK